MALSHPKSLNGNGNSRPGEAKIRNESSPVKNGSTLIFGPETGSLYGAQIPKLSLVYLGSMETLCSPVPGLGYSSRSRSVQALVIPHDPVHTDPCLQVGLTCFYVGLSTLEGKGREAVFAEWRDKFPNTWAVSAAFACLCAHHLSCRLRLLNFLFQISVFIWPILQTINFKFVPAPYRPIYVGVFSFFWTTGLSGLKYSEQTPEFLKGLVA